MGGIVLELQREALAKDKDILQLLRKAFFIAKKLHIKDFEDWISHELKGYQGDCQIPNYRYLRGEVKAWNPYNGWIPVVFEQESGLDIHKARDSIANIIDVYNKSKRYAVINFSAHVNSFLNESSPFDTKYALHISTNQLFNIVESVRPAILEWAISLEENGIVGEEMQFSEREKEIASNTPTINNYTANFFGDVSNSQLQQGTKNSEQTQ